MELEDGGVLNVVEVGSQSGYPLMLLHGGPGLDHHEFRPWLDPLADMGFRLLYVDERGQGASPRVDPASLTMQVFAHDIDRLARALDLGAYGVLGHSFGAFIALSHALERGTADQYVISSGVATTAGLMADVEREIDAFEPAYLRDQIRKSWAEEPKLRTVEQAREVSAAQMPFHFWEMGDAYSRYTQADDTVYAPEVLAHFAANGYGNFEWLDHLRWISKPMLVIAGRGDRVCTVRALRGDPPRGRGVGARGGREGGPHDVRRAAEGLPGRGAALVHPPGRDPRPERPAGRVAQRRRARPARTVFWKTPRMTSGRLDPVAVTCCTPRLATARVPPRWIRTCQPASCIIVMSRSPLPGAYVVIGSTGASIHNAR